MSKNVFIPKINQMQSVEQEDVRVSNNDNDKDNAGIVLQRIAQYSVIVLFGILPIFFTVGLWASLGFSKTILAIAVGALVVVTMSLLTLRRSKALTVLPISLGLFWAVVLVAIISGLLSGDSQEAIRGSVMGVHTAGFIAVLGLAMTIPLALQGSKIMTIKALALFSFVAALLLVYNVFRLFAGGEFLSFSSFGSVTVSPIGGFNDLAIFAGLMVVLGLITLVQLPLKAWLQFTISVLVAISLVILSVVNFFDIWLAVGFFGLLMLVYILSRDSLFKISNDSKPVKSSRSLIVTTALVCCVSALFILAGDYAGGKINAITNIDYVEVRPSTAATIDIVKSVYSEDVLFGIGPNRFEDAWRLYKDPSINETIFWDTDFNAGGGYVLTLFAGVGLLGGLLLILFHLFFLYLGYRMLLRSSHQDSYWYYFGTVSFAAACFVWGMSYVYVPGAGMLLLGALFTGFTFVAAGSLLPSMVRSIPLVVNRRRGFFLMAAIILAITVSVSTLFSVGKQYVAQANFSKAQATAESVEEFEQIALNSFENYSDDRFVSSRAQIQISNMIALLGVTEPTEEQQRRFLSASDQAVNFAKQAVDEDSTNPDNHAIIAGVYSNLAIAGVDGAQERANASLAEAQRLDPINPGYHLIAAQMSARIGDVSSAREEISTALNLKPNFTQALYLSAQLDINEGNTESAIVTTQDIIRLEPNNPTRYFQLGVLFSANNNYPEAINSFQRAVALNADYANARYLLALAYLNTDQTEAGLEQLRVVQQTNTENVDLNSLIQQVESGEFVPAPNTSLEVPVSDVSPDEGFGDTVTTSSDIDTDLVSPVNTASDIEDEEAEVPVDDTEEAVPSDSTDLDETEPTVAE